MEGRAGLELIIEGMSNDDEMDGRDVAMGTREDG